VARDAFAWGRVAGEARAAGGWGGWGSRADVSKQAGCPATTGLSAAPPHTLIYVWLQASCLETARPALLAKPASRVMPSLAAARATPRPAVQAPQPNSISININININIAPDKQTTIFGIRCANNADSCRCTLAVVAGAGPDWRTG
jgi:hypothetical protein